MELVIRIQSLKDLEHGPAFPELAGKPFEEIKVTSCAILERGTQAGRTSLFLHGEDATGKIVAFQLSAAMLDGLNAAVRGAEQRWAEEAKHA